MSGTTPLIEFVLSIYSDTLGHVGEAVADIPEERLAERPPGLTNHPAWTLTHLAAASGFILKLLDDPANAVSDEEFKKFGPGSTPSPDRGAYAGKEELLGRLRARHERVSNVVREKYATYFDRPAPEKLRAFAPTIGRIVVYLLAAHESYHLGQLMQWRKAAGMKAAT